MTIGQTTVADGLAQVRERVAAACEQAGRDPTDVRLIAVSKTHPPAAIREALAAGQIDFGENRIQEGLAKLDALAGSGVQIHLIGSLQRNKARFAGRFASVQSVDSIRLAEAISRRLEAPLSVLLEINAAAEPSKHGFPPEAAADALDRIRVLPYLCVNGLMTIAPLAAEAEQTRPVFRRLRQLRDELGLRELSMGMSNDYAVAIEEGATMVRIGRAVFGERTG